MKKIFLFLSFTLLSVNLFGCQSEENTTMETEQNRFESEDKDTLILNDEFAEISISTSKGVDPTVFEKDKDVEMFKSIFSAAIKEPGEVNMANPEYYLDVIYANENQQSFYLWIGEKGQKTAIMKTDNTHTIYTVPEEMTDVLKKLVE